MYQCLDTIHFVTDRQTDEDIMMTLAHHTA